jgi:hypothetical protein
MPVVTNQRVKTDAIQVHVMKVQRLIMAPVLIRVTAVVQQAIVVRHQNSSQLRLILT